MNIGESTSKANISSFDSKQYCERIGENLSILRNEKSTET
jgi:hypothetical protein